jgi:hypothetical protein
MNTGWVHNKRFIGIGQVWAACSCRLLAWPHWHTKQQHWPHPYIGDPQVHSCSINPMHLDHLPRPESDRNISVHDYTQLFMWISTVLLVFSRAQPPFNCLCSLFLHWSVICMLFLSLPFSSSSPYLTLQLTPKLVHTTHSSSCFHMMGSSVSW